MIQIAAPTTAAATRGEAMAMSTRVLIVRTGWSGEPFGSTNKANDVAKTIASAAPAATNVVALMSRASAGKNGGPSVMAVPALTTINANDRPIHCPTVGKGFWKTFMQSEYSRESTAAHGKTNIATPTSVLEAKAAMAADQSIWLYALCMMAWPMIPVKSSSTNAMPCVYFPFETVFTAPEYFQSQ